MAEFKLLNQKVVNGFLSLMEPLEAFLVSARVHPHVITAAGFVISIIAAYLFIQDLFLPAGLMIILSGVCDILDGRLARATNEFTFGAWCMKQGTILSRIVIITVLLPACGYTRVWIRFPARA